VVNPSLFTNPRYDPVQDFAPISLIAVSPNVITVHPSVPAHGIGELIALIKANLASTATRLPDTSPGKCFAQRKAWTSQR
jgi:tripartite-type tricarboxylate transporter receptor subunit TctC